MRGRRGREQNGLAVPRNNSNAPMRETTFIEIISALLNYFIQQYLNKQIRESKNWVYVQLYTLTQVWINRHIHTDILIPKIRIPR